VTIITPAIRSTQFRETAAKAAVHLVNAYDGIVGRRLKCKRCQRGLPETSFAQIGVRDMPGQFGKVLTVLHGNCHTCRKQARGKWINHPSYSPSLDKFWNDYLPRLRSGAAGRGLFFAVDKDDLLGKYLEQDGICALSGLKMDPYKSGKSSKNGYYFNAPSVDRINNDGHYTADNIQIVMTAVNMMKGELPLDVFLELCGTIATHKMIG
jgi:hypothetical protein